MPRSWNGRPEGKPLTRNEMRDLLQEQASHILREAHRADRPFRKSGRKRGSRGALPAPRPHPSMLYRAGSGLRCVYVIGASGFAVKIGIAQDVEKRLAGLQTGCPHKLRIFFTVEVEGCFARPIERECHEALRKKRMQGEWFKVTAAEAIAAVETIVRRFHPAYEPAE